jgi:hypothetical protein
MVVVDEFEALQVELFHAKYADVGRDGGEVRRQ